MNVRGSDMCRCVHHISGFAAISGLAALNAALDGGLASLPINIIVVIEGEEEIGSPGFAAFLEENKETIFSNAVVLLNADGGQSESGRGSIALSNRGIVNAELSIVGAKSDLHSGEYGGSILNPLVAASRIVASLHEPETNKIAIAGYYDDVIECTPEERAEMEEVDDDALAAALGVRAMVGEQGYSTVERKSVRPTLELVGMHGGFQDEGIKTVLPRKASAKLSMRLVRCASRGV